MKRLLIFLLFSASAWGDSSSLNLNLPTSPQTYATDRIRAGDLDCQNAIGSSTNLEFGVIGIIDGGGNPYDDYTGPYYNNNLPTMGSGSARVDDVGVYAKITIPIGAPKERINCNTLYLLELEKKRMEVLKLKQELANLKELQFVED